MRTPCPGCNCGPCNYPNYPPRTPRLMADTEARELLKELGIVIQDSLLAHKGLLFKGQGSRQIRVTR